jgi:hypothetical protein
MTQQDEQRRQLAAVREQLNWMRRFVAASNSHDSAMALLRERAEELLKKRHQDVKP